MRKYKIVLLILNSKRHWWWLMLIVLINRLPLCTYSTYYLVALFRDYNVLVGTANFQYELLVLCVVNHFVVTGKDVKLNSAATIDR